MQTAVIKKKVVKKSSSKKKRKVRTGSDKLNYLYNLESKSISTFSRLAALFSNQVLQTAIHTVRVNAVDSGRTSSRERNRSNGVRKVFAASLQRSSQNNSNQPTFKKTSARKIAKKSSVKKAAPKKAAKKTAKKAAKKN
ncbi:MAG: hypothetical protein IT237_12360 [Bacteroidia bacterium]|nr:hypothetical protein [Bacteroidia bacterium]